MNDLNHVVFSGNVAKQPEIKEISGAKLGTFRLAAKHTTFNRETKEKKEEVCFISIKAWGIMAKEMESLNVGDPVMITGRLKLEEWVDKKTNEKKSMHVIMAEQIRPLDKKEQQQNISQGSDRYLQDKAPVDSYRDYVKKTNVPSRPVSRPTNTQVNSNEFEEVFEF